MGTIFRRGRSYQIQYYRNGEKLRETVKTSDRQEAKRRLRQREGEIAQGLRPALEAERLTFDDMAKDFIRDYEINGRRSVGKARTSVRHLAEHFGGWRAVNITPREIRAYVGRRQQAGYANGSINRHLAALKRMFRLALQGGRVQRVPHIALLLEAPPRAGFFEPEQFEAVLRQLPSAIQPIALFAYELGWRLRELLTLQWRQVDLQVGSVRLDPGSTKNREGRVAYLSLGLLAVLRAQAEATRALELRRGCIIPWVFHRNGGRAFRQHGGRIFRFTATWRTACRKAGVPGMLFHDLRRTAVRNMVRAGVPERVAMQISGHKTRAVFDRYNVTSEADLADAARKTEAGKQVWAENGQNFDKMHKSGATAYFR
jgi:integrase